MRAYNRWHKVATQPAAQELPGAPVPEHESYGRASFWGLLYIMWWTVYPASLMAGQAHRVRAR